MKTLYLVRHAQARPGDLARSDRERLLEPRGEHDAARMGQRWARQHAAPDRIVASPALRALTTAQAVAEGFGPAARDIVVDDRLYEATLDDLLAVVESLDDTLARVMLVGHNPGFSALAQHFSRDIPHLPTCALVVLTFDAARWAGLGDARPLTVAFDSPQQAPG
jgi:phosphohistidine phosphatase